MPHLLEMMIGSVAPESIVGLLSLIALGMITITKGGDLFTDSSVDIARMTRIPPVIVGATIVSTATSFPEFMVSLTGTMSGSTEFAVGNAVGSCLCNIGLIIGVCAVMRGYIARKQGSNPGIGVSRDMLRGPGMYMFLSCLAVCAFSLFSNGGAGIPGQEVKFGIARWQAGVLFMGMFIYLGYSVRVARLARHESALNADNNATPPRNSTRQILRACVAFAIATAMVVIGSRLLVTNGEAVALRLGVPKLVLGLTLFAIGTSLPEFTISLIAVLKGHEALGVGNIIGSNVLNITWVLASCALITPLPISLQTVVVDLPVTLLLTILTLTMPWKSERISPRAGGVLLAIYLAHLVGITIAGVTS